MAEHAEVHSGTVTADDYPAHAATYQSFVKLIEVAIPTIAATLVCLALIGVKEAATLGVILLLAASIAGVVGLMTRSSWRPPAVIFLIALLALALT